MFQVALFSGHTVVFFFYCSYQGLHHRFLNEDRFGGRRLGSSLIPRELGVTDQCKVVSTCFPQIKIKLKKIIQHLDTLVERKFLSGESDVGESGSGEFVVAKGTRLYRSDREESYLNCQYKNFLLLYNVRLEHNTSLSFRRTVETDQEDAGRLGLPQLGFGSGQLQHDLGLRPVYRGTASKGSTRQEDWVTVDHMFYTTRLSARLGCLVEGRLRLMSRLELPQARYCQQAGIRLPDRQNPSDHFPLAAKFLLAPPK